MEMDRYLNYLLVAVLTITSPGAAILLAINNAMRLHLRAVIFSTLGNLLGLLLLATVAMLGVGVLLKSSPMLLELLRWIGGGYLVYLGIGQIRNRHTHIVLSRSGTPAAYDPKALFRQGFLVAATNPKPILFFNAIFPLFMDPRHAPWTQFAIMTATFLAISFASLMSYGYISTRAKAWFFDEEKLRWFYRISGTIFVLMGIGLALWE
jgi:threonine/homoserine/homoserine lactone efflux protein